MNKKWIGIGLGAVVLVGIVLFAAKERKGPQKEQSAKEKISTAEVAELERVPELPNEEAVTEPIGNDDEVSGNSDPAVAMLRDLARTYETGVLPVEDAVVEQNGTVETREGTGAEFEQHLAGCFSGAFTAKTHRTLTDNPTSEQLFNQARRMRVDYMLRTSIGKVHLAKSGANRPDYAYLEKAYMFDVRKKQKVWELSRPLYVEKSNGGKNSLLLKVMAAYVSDSIRDHAKTNSGGR